MKQVFEKAILIALSVALICGLRRFTIVNEKDQQWIATGTVPRITGRVFSAVDSGLSPLTGAGSISFSPRRTNQQNKDMTEQHVFFNVGNLKLEGMYFQAPPPNAYPAVICHPHPAYGGTMDNNVVIAAAKALRETGHSTLRFNFRGVGRSEGHYEAGAGELADVRAALDFVLKKAGNDATVTLVGYSFGAWVAMQALAGDNSVAHLILIGPPTSMFDLSPLLKDKEERARHFIVGDRDQFCNRQKLQEIYDKLPAPKSLKIIPHTDHFFFAHEKFLMDAIKEAVSDH